MPHDRISIDPRIMVGKPCVRGTRVTVEKVLRELGNGLTPEAIVAEYPRLTLEDIRAAQAFAAEALARAHAPIDSVEHVDERAPAGR